MQNYNNNFKETFDCIYKNTDNIEEFLYKTHLSDFTDEQTTTPNSISNASDADTNNDINVQTQSDSSISNNKPITNSNTHYIENTLIISETRGKVILPYTISKVQEIFSQNNDIYLSLKDVIDKVFTLPIDYYHFSPIARFKEAFKLVRYKEKGSKVKALALAFELFVNYNLHPAVITACNSLDELDIYLACLEENNLQDFHFFNIIYEIPLATYNPKHSL